MESERLVFRTIVENMFSSTLRGRLSAGCKSQLRAVGIDLDRPLLPAYKNEVWERCLELVAHDLFGKVDGESMRSLGALFTQSFTQSMMGVAVFRVAGMLGIKRAVGRANRYEANSNFHRAQIEDAGPNALVLTLTGSNHFPEFTQGTLQASLEAMGAKNPRVEITRTTADGASFRLAWD